MPTASIKPKRRVTVYLDDKTFRALDKQSRKERRTWSGLTQVALESYMKSTTK